ncbi:DUF3429 domain-containing protein [Salipiger sp. P9]|uniref:DUF3429 domain-containing protein n=1 Tax=Salipiger pentaromativorans TaxID=2943193 RepID=UPI002157CF89|nr:DUF3429 domain-containing protein [Salipiger pentaromativorans]MCR8548317.1 DUF3429 domain-containing protein [Salipiger pentaromativorans]
MATRIPRSALFLGLAGLLPFLWGVLTLLSDPAYELGYNALGGRFIGPYIQLDYGRLILAFMSGVLWGFATKAREGQAATGYALSVIPALWAFLMGGGGPVSAGMNLIFGYLGLLALDWQFWRWGLAPAWWMRLRLPLTAIVVACLLVGVVR